ncbi:MAG: hypothetical protein OEW73_08040 [Gammaproteobacteria bacterium]|nr:hypothetical protein [Gammaproteobacteria bacterium]MDH5262687.1 hypothetical protein [Gammaproteobacteria bacterium]
MSNTDGEHESSPTQASTRLERWALFAEIAGAVAVVLSVAYLALQVSDNNKLLRSQAHYNALELGQRPLEIMLENESLAGVLVSCEQAPEAVDRVGWERCSNYYFLEFNSWEYFYYQHDDGSIPPQLWSGADAYYKQKVATNPGYARYWSEWQIAFDEPFRSYVTAEFAALRPEK